MRWCTVCGRKIQDDLSLVFDICFVLWLEVLIIQIDQFARLDLSGCVWSRVFVTNACVGLCMSRVFVICIWMWDVLWSDLTNQWRVPRGSKQHVALLPIRRCNGLLGATSMWLSSTLLLLPIRSCNDLCGPTCLWLCSLCLHHRRRYLFRSGPGTFVKTYPACDLKC